MKRDRAGKGRADGPLLAESVRKCGSGEDGTKELMVEESIKATAKRTLRRRSSWGATVLCLIEAVTAFSLSRSVAIDASALENAHLLLVPYVRGSLIKAFDFFFFLFLPLRTSVGDRARHHESDES